MYYPNITVNNKYVLPEYNCKQKLIMYCANITVNKNYDFFLSFFFQIRSSNSNIYMNTSMYYILGRYIPKEQCFVKYIFIYTCNMVKY